MYKVMRQHTHKMLVRHHAEVGVSPSVRQGTDSVQRIGVVLACQTAGGRGNGACFRLCLGLCGRQFLDIEKSSQAR